MFVRCEAFLYDCAAFNDIRRNQVSLSTMEELFDSVDMRQVIDFMKDVNFYNIVFNLLVFFQLLCVDFTILLIFSVDPDSLTLA